MLTSWAVVFLSPNKFLKIFFKDVVGIKNINTFADPFTDRD